MGAPWITIIAQLQASVQSFLRPAVWLPLIRCPHSREEKWAMPSNSNQSNLDDILRGLMSVSLNDQSRSYWKVKKADSKSIQVHVFTRAEWLDVIEFELLGSTVKVHSFSSGFLPLFIPLAFIINLFFFWIPFYDFGLNKKRLTKIVEAMDMGIHRSS